MFTEARMTPRPKKETRITVSLATEDYRDLDEIAGKSDVSIAWVIRRAIAEFLERHRGSAFSQLPLQDNEEKPL